MVMTEKLLTPNSWSRPRTDIIEVRAIVLHWFFDPGKSARGAVSWWEQRKNGKNGYGSGHYAIDDSETIIAVPTTEVAYHVGAESYTDFASTYLEGQPNFYTLAVEMSHGDMTGRPSQMVWEHAVELVRLLCDLYSVPESMIVTHFDITGMRPYWRGHPCHKWFVTQPGEMAQFRVDVRERA